MILVCFTDRVPKQGDKNVRCEFLLADEGTESDLALGPQVFQQIWLREVHRRLQVPVAPDTFPTYPAGTVTRIVFIEIRVEPTAVGRRFVGYEYRDDNQAKLFMEKLNASSDRPDP